MVIYIRNMVSSRCISKVKSELEKVGVTDAAIFLGKVEFSGPTNRNLIRDLQRGLSDCGLEVIHGMNVELAESIKSVIAEMIDDPAINTNMTNSQYISFKLGKSYSYLASVFADIMNTSISQYIISYRIARTKDLIKQNNYSLSEIAFRFNYSSIGHLSNQFKQITGVSPSVYRRIAGNLLSESSSNGTLTDHEVPHAFNAAAAESLLRTNFNEAQLSINKI